MKLGDITKFGTYEEVLENLEKLKSALNKSAKEIPVKPIDDFAGFALTKLISYSLIQIERLILYVQFPIEVHALIARNLFECSLLCDYFMLDSANARLFIFQKAIDEIQINEGILGLSVSELAEKFTLPLIERNNHIRFTLQKHGIIGKELKIWTVKFLAEQTNNVDEYNAFFKLYSKYVHPSPWTILGEVSEYDNDTYRNIFLIQAQYYSSRIIKICEDYPNRILKN